MRRKKKRKNKSKSEQGLRELLKLLKTHPRLASALVFDPEKIKRLLKSKEARRMIAGVDAGTLLMSIGDATGETPLALCMQVTAIVVPPTPCPGNTLTLPTCPGNTRTLPTCPGNTRTLPTCPGNTRTLPTCPGNTRYGSS